MGRHNLLRHRHIGFSWWCLLSILIRLLLSPLSIGRRRRGRH